MNGSLAIAQATGLFARSVFGQGLSGVHEQEFRTKDDHQLYFAVCSQVEILADHHDDCDRVDVADDIKCAESVPQCRLCKLAAFLLVGFVTYLIYALASAQHPEWAMTFESYCKEESKHTQHDTAGNPIIRAVPCRCNLQKKLCALQKE